jgi:hypothetical protein
MRWSRLGFVASSLTFVVTAAFAGDPAAPPPPPLPIGCAPLQYSWDFSLRSSFNDLGPQSCPRGLLSAEGATLSGANNLLTGQYSASVDGLAALAYRFHGQGGFHGVSMGAYLQADDSYQFEPTKTQTYNGDTLTSGGFTEFSFNNPLINGIHEIDDFRFRGGETFGSAGITSTTFVGEWIPSYTLGPVLIAIPERIPNTALWATISPELMVQYDQLDSGPNKYTIFAARDEALRIGPQVMLTLNVQEDELPAALPKSWRSFIASTSATITNHESWDSYIGKEYSWTMVAFTYTNPDMPNFGVTATYGYGNSEATGIKTNQVKLGLALKN